MADALDQTELLNKIEAAKGATEELREPRAIKAGYDRQTGEIFVLLDNDFSFRFLTQMGQGLTGASPEELAQVEITPSGQGLRWESLDADLSIPDLLDGIYRTRKSMKEIDKSGDASTSVAKAADARENGTEESVLERKRLL